MIKKTIFSILIIYVFALLTPLNSLFNKSTYADNKGNKVSAGFSNRDTLQFSEEEKQWIKDHPVIRARIGAAPPLHFFEGSPKGISVDYLNLIAERVGFQVKYITKIPWSKAIDSIKNHEKIDLILTAKITEERQKFISFTDNYLIIPLVIFTRNEIGFISGVEDLKHKTVSVERGYVLHRQLMNQFPEIELLVVETSREAVEAVAIGKADAYIGNLTITTYIIRQNNLNNVKIAAPTPFDNHNQAMAIRDDWPQLTSIINKSFKSLTPEEHIAIKNRWMKVRYEYGISKLDVIRWILVISIFSILIIGIIMFWNRRLKKEIIQREESERLLTDSEKRYRQMFETNPAVKLIINPKDSSIVEANDAACQFYGYSKNEIVSLKISDINVLPLDKIVEEMDKAKSSNKLFFNFPHKLASGEIKDVEVYSGPIKYGQNTFLHSIIHDVTERKKAEEAIKRSESMQSKMVANIGDVIVIIDQEGINRYKSTNIEKLFGWKPEEVVGSSVWETIHIDDLEATQKFFGKLMSEPATVGTTECRYRCKDGSYNWIKLTGTNLLHDPDINGLLGNYHDITERKQAEVEREKLQSQLAQAQKMESIGSLAGGIAHDFNNLLFPIIGMSEMLLEDLPQNSLEHENAQEIFNAGRRAGDLVKQILAFSRQSEHKMTPVRIQNILKEVLKLSRSTIPSNIEIQGNIDWNCGLIMADATQIHQVAMNLITNAFHAIEEKNGIIDITLKEIELKNGEISDSLLHPDRYIQLSVADNGAGMAQSIQKKIFDPYFTTKEMGKGTGLGLAVVYGIIKEHKGDIKVYSEEGKGSTFNIYLPLMKTNAIPVLDNQSLKLPTGTEKILLVDDEISVAKLEGQMLSRLGYHVTEQTDSFVAFNEFKTNPDNFDLVISDMTMPNMTGDQLAKGILLIRPDMPIIICTGFSERVNKEQAEIIGVKGFLMKPVGKYDMAQLVRNVLDKAKNP